MLFFNLVTKIIYDYISSIIPSRFSNRWFHKSDISNIDEFNYNVNYYKRVDNFHSKVPVDNRNIY